MVSHPFFLVDFNPSKITPNFKGNGGPHPVPKNWVSNRVLKMKQRDPVEKQNWTRSRSLFGSLFWNTFRFLKKDGLMSNWIRTKWTTLSHDVSKRMITLLRHEQDILREEDGAIEFWPLKRDIRANFPHSVRWSNETWVNHLQRGGGRKKRFHFCTNRTGTATLYFRAVQGHSGETTVDPSLLENVLIPWEFFQFIH